MSESYTQFEELTVTNGAVVPLTAATYGNLNRALITCADANIKFTVDGTTPTTGTGVGHILYDSDELKLTSREEVVNFQCIAISATNVELSASYGGKVSS